MICSLISVAFLCTSLNNPVLPPHDLSTAEEQAVLHEIAFPAPQELTPWREQAILEDIALSVQEALDRAEEARLEAEGIESARQHRRYLDERPELEHQEREVREELERQEIERQERLERERVERERQAELERQRERERQAELERQRERERQAELERQRERERQAEREAEAKRQREREAAQQQQQTVQASGSGAAAVAAAVGQVGTPYVWGGNTTSGFDCSGLTSWAWARAGVTIPRTSAAQYAGLTKVSRGNLRPGDLVFYHSPISHVAMYIGNGQMVESPRRGIPVRVVTLRSGAVGYARP